mmetsp:Transcript_957/g.1931  ORF Transcript_957/g.1931 Transcript_957/m.1931 type:complete len:245 (+) Transcript_957:1211-1945(+)
MKKAMLEELPHGAFDVNRDEVQRILAPLPDGRLICQLDTVDPFHDDDPASSERRIDYRNLEIYLVAIELPEALCVLDLVLIIELLKQTLTEGIYEANKVIALQALRQKTASSHQKLGELSGYDQVQADNFVHLGPLHFHGYFGPICEASMVDLPERGSRDRNAVKLAEELRGAPDAQLPVEEPHSLLLIKRFNAILELLEFFQKDLWKHIWPYAQRLPKFHKSRPERGKQISQLQGEPALARLL